ncbi:MAG: hypothetical protein ACUVTL_07310 [Thermoproteota archaeon]
MSITGVALWNGLNEIASKECRTIIGLMSGTSADGVTACIARLASSYDRMKLDLIGTKTYPFFFKYKSEDIRAFDPPTATVEKIVR